MAGTDDGNDNDTIGQGEFADGTGLTDDVHVDRIIDGDDSGRGTTSTGTSADPNAPADPAGFVRRGRGRPRKDSAGTASSEGSESRARQSKSGSATKKGVDLNTDLFAMQLVGVHKMLAAVMKNPLMEISESEAKKLALALKQVMALHKIAIPAEYVAYVQLLGVCAALYGPRIALTMAAKKAAAEAEKNTFENNHPIPGL